MRRAENAAMNRRAARELEILIEPARQNETGLRAAVVRKAQGIAEAIEPLVVECGSRQRLVAPIARRDIRAFDARLVFSAERREFQSEPRQRQADIGSMPDRARRLPYERARKARFRSRQSRSSFECARRRLRMAISSNAARVVSLSAAPAKKASFSELKKFLASARSRAR